MGRYIVKSTPNKVLVDKVADTFRRVDALDKAQKDIDKKLQEDIAPIINETIPEVRAIAEQASQDAGSALGDIQTLYDVDLPTIDGKASEALAVTQTLTSETWTFTFADGTTVDKKVVLQ